MQSIHLPCTAIIVPIGYTDDSIFAQVGNPYGISATQSPETYEISNEIKPAIEHQTRRLIEITQKFIG